jgi:DNA repair exonuclease SbcCD ATPase subunit
VVRQAVTHDQEYLEAILDEQQKCRRLLERIAERIEGKESGMLVEALDDEAVCDVCGRGFRNARALRAHKRIH